MLHAYLYTIFFVFCFTSWHFYAFSRTNLLMRWHSASSLFSVVFVFQKSYIGNILRIGRNKSQSSYSSQHETESKAEMEGSQRVATPPPHHGAGHPLAMSEPGVGPWSTSGRRPSAYIFPSMGNPKMPDQLSSKHTVSRRSRRREIGRVQKLFSAPCQRGESPPEAFFITMPPSGVMCT
jgi:hypothetical protein